MNQNQQHKTDPRSQPQQKPLSSREMLIKNRKQIAVALEMLFASDYISRRKLYTENFIRGMFFAIGGVFGVTLGLGVILWFFSLFDQIPLIGPIIEDVTNQINSSVRSGKS